jgi:hypothetical protein
MRRGSGKREKGKGQELREKGKGKREKDKPAGFGSGGRRKDQRPFVEMW